MAERLQQVELLLRQFDCTSADELLECSAQAEADLDAWFAMEGEQHHMTARCCWQEKTCIHYLYLCSTFAASLKRLTPECGSWQAG